MREIKLRAWHQGVMYRVYAIDWAENGDIISFHSKHKKHYPHPNEKDTVFLEYTGLKDKNGKEIYEGYICKHLKLTLVVKFRYGCFFLCSKDDNGEIMNSWATDFHEVYSQYKEADKPALSKLEVIGDIYRNPELLNKE